ncbi:chorismate-binding protein [Jiulongibacter sp. NS-SX5]|uniref:chorismate-binding protein n=1 Tax=Jiulongibacter sp. NS-SX5 TaxID=3463854 RepID=UPI004059632B
MIITQTKGLTTASVLQELSTGELSFALWRSPSEKQIHILVSLKEEQKIKKNDLDELPEGFLMAPFRDDQPSYFIEADLHFEINSLEEQLPDKALHFFKTQLQGGGQSRITNEKIEPLAIFSDPQEKEAFESLVRHAINKIKEEEEDFLKVVLSRKKEVKLPEGFDGIQHFQKITEKYPSLFCSLVYLPQQSQTWIGASPETLVSQNEFGTFETMALAGTQSAFDANGKSISCPEALWSQKEIEEQALVSRYIINCFKKIRVREFEEIGPRTVQAGNLLHLQTRFKVDTERINFSQMSSVMLDLLHPTSAVCGMPKDIAQQFILENEPYNRGMYSGYLGPVNVQQKTNLYVNLRSLCISEGSIQLYAGCGITADSNPEKEWNETEMKLKTILA